MHHRDDVTVSLTWWGPVIGEALKSLAVTSNVLARLDIHTSPSVTYRYRSLQLTWLKQSLNNLKSSKHHCVRRSINFKKDIPGLLQRIILVSHSANTQSVQVKWYDRPVLYDHLEAIPWPNLNFQVEPVPFICCYARLEYTIHVKNTHWIMKLIKNNLYLDICWRFFY